MRDSSGDESRERDIQLYSRGKDKKTTTKKKKKANFNQNTVPYFPVYNVHFFFCIVWLGVRFKPLNTLSALLVQTSRKTRQQRKVCFPCFWVIFIFCWVLFFKCYNFNFIFHFLFSILPQQNKKGPKIDQINTLYCLFGQFLVIFLCFLGDMGCLWQFFGQFMSRYFVIITYYYYILIFLHFSNNLLT